MFWIYSKPNFVFAESTTTNKNVHGILREGEDGDGGENDARDADAQEQQFLTGSATQAPLLKRTSEALLTQAMASIAEYSVSTREDTLTIPAGFCSSYRLALHNYAANYGLWSHSEVDGGLDDGVKRVIISRQRLSMPPVSAADGNNTIGYVVAREARGGRSEHGQDVRGEVVSFHLGTGLNGH